ncbi:MAG TPA: hypothetical protein VIK56_01580 [Rhodoferax sp.]
MHWIPDQSHGHKKTTKAPLTVETLKHDDATRKNIPTAEYSSTTDP